MLLVRFNRSHPQEWRVWTFAWQGRYCNKTCINALKLVKVLCIAEHSGLEWCAILESGQENSKPSSVREGAGSTTDFRGSHMRKQEWKYGSKVNKKCSKGEHHAEPTSQQPFTPEMCPRRSGHCPLKLCPEMCVEEWEENGPIVIQVPPRSLELLCSLVDDEFDWYWAGTVVCPGTE